MDILREVKRLDLLSQIKDAHVGSASCSAVAAGRQVGEARRWSGPSGADPRRRRTGRLWTAAGGSARACL